MSQLVISSSSQTFYLNVLSFSSPLYGTIANTQVRKCAVYFPIKMAQPDIQFDVVFANETDYQAFQLFVRQHQMIAQASTALLTLNWPERDIANFTGFIRHFEAGGKRFNVGPHASFIVDLVDSFVTTRTQEASIAAGWNTIYDLGIPGSVLAPPTLQELEMMSSTTVNTLSGQALNAARTYFPGLFNNGILAGTGF